MNRKTLLTAAFLLPTAASAFAQDRPALSEEEAQGRILFFQSCGVCHSEPRYAGFTSYGPLLSGNVIDGREDLVNEVITQGTPRMPGFGYHFSAEQISAIIAYLKTVPEPRQTESGVELGSTSD